MWTLLLSTALAAEAPLHTEGEGAEFHVIDAQGRRVLPDDFAEAVGDERTLARYDRTYGYARAAGLTGWVGGPVLLGTGGIFVLAGVFGGDPYLAFGGLASASPGAAVLAGGTAGYAVGRRRSNRMTSWYTRAEADALLVESGLGGGPGRAGALGRERDEHRAAGGVVRPGRDRGAGAERARRRAVRARRRRHAHLPGRPRREVGRDRGRHPARSPQPEVHAVISPFGVGLAGSF
ncbi:MAG: hypothetical protein GY913_24345 [Proteobacteria bacterium]|nr:hypothetical protein [Pseudomonadota bacterium]MCP4920046.1 hypothetical protein [Pseudomonadota bacterium]